MIPPLIRVFVVSNESPTNLWKHVSMLGFNPTPKKFKVTMCLQEQLSPQILSDFSPGGLRSEVRGQGSEVRVPSAGHRSAQCGQKGEPHWAEHHRLSPPGGSAEESPAPPACCPAE